MDAASKTLTSVFHNHEVVLLRNRHHDRHIRHPPTQVDWDDCAGLVCYSCLDLCGIDVEVIRHIDKHRSRPNVDHCRTGRYESMGWHNHFIANTDPRSTQ